MNLHGLMYGLGTHSSAAPSTERAAARSASSAREVKDDLRFMEERLDKLALVCMAMWSLLIEKNGMTEEQLMERVREIDLQDGDADGRVGKKVRKCLQCGRTMSPRHSRCLYCGAEEAKLSAFDDVS